MIFDIYLAKCATPFKIWYLAYLVSFVIKLIVSFYTYQHLRQKKFNYETHDGIKEAQKALVNLKVFTFLYINSILLAVLLAGNIVYFGQGRNMKT